MNDTGCDIASTGDANTSTCCVDIAAQEKRSRTGGMTAVRDRAPLNEQRLRL